MNSNPSEIEEYDLVVLGSGEGGKFLAWTLAKQGQRVAVVERRYIGGACPNIACLPSKNMIHSAKVASYFSRSEEFGITHQAFAIDMEKVRQRKRKMVDELVAMHVHNFETSGAQLIQGTGAFVAPKTIEVTLPNGSRRTLRGSNVIINTGSRATLEPIPGLAESRPLTHVDALELDTVPEHLLIVGGGFVGLEFAQMMRRFGSKVTVVERNGSLLHSEDEDVSAALLKLMIDEGIDVLTGAQVRKVERLSPQSVKVEVFWSGAETTLHGSHLLIAAGRTPNTSGIGLELAGIETTSKGHIKVDERLATTASGVWAMGDCAGHAHFTHASFDDFRIVRDNLFGGSRVTTGRLMPSCLFTDPEFARVGLNETEARARQIPYRLAKMPMAGALRTRTLSETRGFAKCLIDTGSDRILGFVAFGFGAGEIMSTVQVAMEGGLPYTHLRDAIFAHPTLTEGLIPLLSSVPSRP